MSCGENRTKKSKNSAGFVFKDVPDLILRASIPVLPFQNGSCCGSCFAVISVIGYHVLSLSEVQRKVSCANNLRFNVEEFAHLKMCSFFVLNWYQLQRQQGPTLKTTLKPIENQWIPIIFRFCKSPVIPLSLAEFRLHIADTEAGYPHIWNQIQQAAWPCLAVFALCHFLTSHLGFLDVSHNSNAFCSV